METSLTARNKWVRLTSHTLALMTLAACWATEARSQQEGASAAAPAAASTDAVEKREPAAVKVSAEPIGSNADAPDDLSVLLSRYHVAEPVPAPVSASTANVAGPIPARGLSSATEGVFDGAVNRAGCASCGGQGPVSGGSCSSCGANRCVPGRGNCTPPCPDSFYGRLFGNLYECLCCPDPCYQPSWVPEANASFFTNYARPRTVTRLRLDHNWNMVFPDRSEYFWARQNLNSSALRTLRGLPVPSHWGGAGKGPKFPQKFSHPGLFGTPKVNYDQLSFYQEAASARASVFIEMPYRSLTPNYLPHTAGFGDLNFGTKALLVDCEMMQLTFQFKTYTPTGQPAKGFGTGHVSLEPGLLLALRLAPDTYFQGSIAEWIPLGGDQAYAGAILKYSGSFNRTILRTSPDSPLIATLELAGMTFQDGLYTNPYTGPHKSSGGTYLNLGPGLRHSVCDRLDYGGAITFPVTDSGHWANPALRFEVRLLF